MTVTVQMLMKLEGQRTALENAGHNVAVMKVLEYTNKVLKGANKNLDIDKVRLTVTIIDSERNRDRDRESVLSLLSPLFRLTTSWTRSVKAWPFPTRWQLPSLDPLTRWPMKMSSCPN